MSAFPNWLNWIWFFLGSACDKLVGHLMGRFIRSRAERKAHDGAHAELAGNSLVSRGDDAVGPDGEDVEWLVDAIELAVGSPDLSTTIRAREAVGLLHVKLDNRELSPANVLHLRRHVERVFMESSTSNSQLHLQLRALLPKLRTYPERGR